MNVFLSPHLLNTTDTNDSTAQPRVLFNRIIGIIKIMPFFIALQMLLTQMK